MQLVVHLKVHGNMAAMADKSELQPESWKNIEEKMLANPVINDIRFE